LLVLSFPAFGQTEEWKAKKFAGTYICAALEDDGLMARTLTISKSADCLGRFVRVCSEEIIEALKPYFFQEPLAVEKSSVNLKLLSS
jgi:hypothetical protein